MKELVGTFNQEKVLVGAFSVIVKTDGSFAALARKLDTGLAAPSQTWRGGSKVDYFIVSLISNLQPELYYMLMENKVIGLVVVSIFARRRRMKGKFNQKISKTRPLENSPDSRLLVSSLQPRGQTWPENKNVMLTFLCSVIGGFVFTSNIDLQ